MVFQQEQNARVSVDTWYVLFELEKAAILKKVIY